MMDVLSITGPIYLTIAIGFLVTRLGLFAKADMRVFGKFVINLALPALLFNALSQRRLGEILNVSYLLVYALGSLVVLVGAVIWANVRLARPLGESSYFAMGTACSNSGFVGYPVVLLLLGPVAAVSLALNMVVENLLVIPLLLMLADMGAGGRSGNGHWWRAVLQTMAQQARNPMIVAIVIGFAFSLLGWQLPGPVARTVNLFSQASGALALFVIGGTLVGLRVKGMRSWVAQIALGKLILHPLAVLAVLWLIPIADPALRTAVILTAAMPMMGIYPILAQRHGHEDNAAAALLVTTVASFFTLSGLLWVLKHPIS
ncbi:MAG: hypothetical protein RJA34_242 [Pseudomonadota bacterium]|jgi:predicted permease